jgi:hypothetical protein
MSIDRAVRGARGMVTIFPPFAGDGKGAMPSLHRQVFDVGSQRF